MRVYVIGWDLKCEKMHDDGVLIGYVIICDRMCPFFLSSFLLSFLLSFLSSSPFHRLDCCHRYPRHFPRPPLLGGKLRHPHHPHLDFFPCPSLSRARWKSVTKPLSFCLQGWVSGCYDLMGVMI